MTTTVSHSLIKLNKPLYIQITCSRHSFCAKTSEYKDLIGKVCFANIVDTYYNNINGNYGKVIKILAYYPKYENEITESFMNREYIYDIMYFPPETPSVWNGVMYEAHEFLEFNT